MLVKVLKTVVKLARPSLAPSQRAGLYSNGSIAHARREHIFKYAGNPTGLVRWVEADKKHKSSFYRYPKAKHLDSIPEDVARLYGELSRASRPVNKEAQTDVPEVLEATTLLGGTEIDFVCRILPFPRGGRGLGLKSIYPDRDGNPGYVCRVDAQLVIAAFERCDVKHRAAAIEGLDALHAMTQTAFVDYLFKQFDKNSENLREAVRKRLAKCGPQMVEERALAGLNSRKKSHRTSAMKVLGDLGTPAAKTALEKLSDTDATLAVLTGAEVFLETDSASTGTSYIDVLGNEVTVPERAIPVDDGKPYLGQDFLKELKRHEEIKAQEAQAEYARRVAYWEKSNATHQKPKTPERREFADAWFAALTQPVTDSKWRVPYTVYRGEDGVSASLEAAIAQLPIRRVVNLAIASHYSHQNVLNGYSLMDDAFREKIREKELSLTQVFDILNEQRPPVPLEDGSLPVPATATYLKSLLKERPSWDRSIEIFDDVWELSTRHLDILAGALPPRSGNVAENIAAMRIAATFPTLPKMLLQPVLMAAIDGRQKLNKPAQNLLKDVPGIDDLLIPLLSDAKQSIRANTARFLALRGAKSALPDIQKRLKKEKSDIARTELLSALETLGGDTEPYLGKAALVEEAQGFVAKLSADKFAWLDIDSAPALRWADGSPADPVLLDGWLRLACKLKAPGQSTRFALYLRQLAPESAQAISDWVLHAWIAYDTYSPPLAELRPEAEKKAKAFLANNSYARYYGFAGVQEAAQYFLKKMSATYANSAHESKGILALTTCAEPASATAAIQAYLKKHGKRVSQAKSLVETLNGMGTMEAIQVLVATATRFRQKTVRALAETFIQEIAEARGWSEDELADRSVPSGGFDADGTLDLPMGEDEKPYVARLTSELDIKLFNPSGKEVKSLPAGSDENSKSSKALFTAAKKTLKTVTAQQKARLYEGMLTPRRWSLASWQNDLAQHPILRRLMERVIWRGLDTDGAPVNSLRLTSEGELLNADGDDVDLSKVEFLVLAHSANLSEADYSAWQAHFKDFEVTPLFPQISRPVQKLDEAQAKTAGIKDREGWMMSSFQLRSAAKKVGYERGPIEDSGGFYIYRKEFRSAGLWVDLRFSGSSVNEEDIPIALTRMEFARISTGDFGRTLHLGKVPPLLLSEAWNDLHEVAKSGAHDPEWSKKTYY
ncbi:MAG: DUF4132 domain-containing protein [Pseudomonadota bacterium]